MKEKTNPKEVYIRINPIKVLYKPILTIISNIGTMIRTPRTKKVLKINMKFSIKLEKGSFFLTT